MDITYLLVIQVLRESIGGVLNSFFIFMSTIADHDFLVFGIALVAWCISKKYSRMMALAISINITVNNVTKMFFKIPRPYVRDSRITPLDTENTYSFTSGHSARAVSTYGACGHEAHREKKKTLSVLLWVMVGLVMFSRNWIGVHTPEDVLGSCLVGLLSMPLISWLDDKSEGNSRFTLITGAVLCAIALIAAFVFGFNRNFGLAFGAGMGWAIEKCYVNYSAEGSLYDKIVRYIAGGLMLALVYFFVSSILQLICGKNVGSFLSGALTGLFIFVIYPAIFMKFERNRKNKCSTARQSLSA